MEITLNNLDNFIDSRDVIARIKELEEEYEGLEKEVERAKLETDLEESEDVESAQQAMDDWNEEKKELEMLRVLMEDGESCSSDWHHGETLIRYDHFEDYCMELCEDCGYVPKEFPGFIVIDWSATADNLKADYDTVDFDGVEYYIRST